jgi:flagellar protein FliS
MSLAAYQTSQDLNVLSASPMELVRMLYSGALSAVRAARENLESGDIRERSRQITKACSIIEELAISLNKEQGGKVAQDLAELYVYMHQRLIQANIQQQMAPLVEVQKLLETLFEAWRQIPDQLPSAGRNARDASPIYGSSGGDDLMESRGSIQFSA